MQKAGAKSKSKAPQIRAKGRPALRSVVSHKAAIQKAFHPFLMPLHGSKRERGGDKSPRGLGPASPLRQPSVRQNAPLSGSWRKDQPQSSAKICLHTDSLPNSFSSQKSAPKKSQGTRRAFLSAANNWGWSFRQNIAQKTRDWLQNGRLAQLELRFGKLHSSPGLGSGQAGGYPAQALIAAVGGCKIAALADR